MGEVSSTATGQQPSGNLLDDLDSILGMPAPVVAAPTVAAVEKREEKTADPFSGLGLGSLGFSMSSSGMKKPAQGGGLVDVFSTGAQVRTITVYSNPDVRVDFAVSSKSNGVDITASFHSHQRVLSDFVLEAAVPKYLKLTLQPATSPVVQPDTVVTQKLTVTQASEPAKPIMMKLRIRYVLDGMPVEELTT
ncbi:hypothetical protein Pmar_PMAR012095, partial [Perkinsus marinus ATCC 50983]